MSYGGFVLSKSQKRVTEAVDQLNITKMGLAMELFRMCTYLSFPMTLFYIANKPELFDKNVNALFEKEEQLLRSPTKEQIAQRIKEIRKAKAERAALKESDSSQTS